MEFDKDIKQIALKNAINIYDMIRQSFNDPTKMVIGEAAKVYDELQSWEIVDKYPVVDDKNKWLYTHLIAMQQYKHLKWQKDHPAKKNEKRSKWEVVHGKMSTPSAKIKIDNKKGPR